MVTFVTNCYKNLGGVEVIALLLCNRYVLKCIFPCNYIKVEIKI